MENATGIGYEELLAKYITRPYQMTNTTMTLTGNQTAELVTPYRKDKRDIETEPWRMGKMAPPSATYSTTEDLLKLIEKQLIAQVKYNTSQKTSPLVLSEHNIPLAEGATVSYGYGLFIGSNGYYGHGGDMDGYGSEYSFSVKNNHALVLLTSSGGKWVPKLILAINEILNKD